MRKALSCLLYLGRSNRNSEPFYRANYKAAMLTYAPTYHLLYINPHGFIYDSIIPILQLRKIRHKAGQILLEVHTQAVDLPR